MNSDRRHQRLHRHGVKSTLATAIGLALAGNALSVRAGPSLPLPDPGAVFATLGAATYSVDGSNAVVQQTTDRAILNWRSFDIGEGHVVTFRQPSTNSVALNRIDANGRPSQILGRLEANGQVWLQNPNGVLFGPDARVDVSALVATSLGVADSVIEKGLTSAILNREPAFASSAGRLRRDGAGAVVIGEDGNPIPVSIEVQAGGRIQTRGENGRIILAAPMVSNAGTLESNAGQVLLVAAADTVFLQEADPDSSGVRGLRVEIGSGGTVANVGEILTRRGNTTLAGFAVNQNGRVTATTSVRLNGSIRLQATEGVQVETTVEGPVALPTRTARAADQGDSLGTLARVTFGQGSRTEVIAETEDPAGAIDEQVQPDSRIDVVGRLVTLEAGAQLLAPSGRVDILATAIPRAPDTETVASPDAQIHLHEGSRIDVAGLDAEAPVERNIVEVHLLSNELRDAPVQKTGGLFNARVQVDARIGTPLADVSGATARIERSLAERLGTGGTVTLRSAGDLTLDTGSTIDLSGGVVTYQAGFTRTSQLLSEDGRVFDIGSAHPLLRYVGVLDGVTREHPRWGVMRNWDLPGPFGSGRFEPAYQHGHSAGELTLTASTIRMDGELRAERVNGVYQREIAQRAAGGRLEIDLARFGRTTGMAIIDRTLLTAVRDALTLDDDRLTSWGVTRLGVRTGGAFMVGSGVQLSLGAGGRLAVEALTVDVAGKVDAPGGEVSLESVLGHVRLHPTATIGVHGNVVSDIASRSDSPVATDGGRVRLIARGDLDLASGSRIDASGGAWFKTRDDLLSPLDASGKAGTITLRASRQGGSAARMTLDGSLHALSLSEAGTLDITAASVTLAAASGQAAASGGLTLTPAFFAAGTFGAYRLTADRDGLTVAAGALYDLRQASYLLDDLRPILRGSARSLDEIATAGLLPDFLRQGPILTLALERTVPGGDPANLLAIAAGSRLRTEAGGGINLIADASIDVAGALISPAGTVSLAVVGPADRDFFGTEIEDPEYRPNQGIRLQAGALLDASAVVRTRPDSVNPWAGDLLSAGQVQVRAERGFLAIAPGARLVADGASGFLADPSLAGRGLGQTFERQALAAPAGKISLFAAEAMLLDGTLSARAADGIGAAGGTLEVTLSTEARRADPYRLPSYPTAPRGVLLAATASGRAEALAASGSALPRDLEGIAQLPTAAVEAGGFTSLDIRADDLLRVTGSADIALARRLQIDVPLLDLSDTTGTSRLAASYVRLGSSLQRSVRALPTPGLASLQITGDLIDIEGALSLCGVRDTLLSSRGDIRLRGITLGENNRFGEFLSASPLTLSAEQIYPTTFTSFRIAVLSEGNDLLQIRGAGPGRPVLSAGGSLTIEAPNITVSGQLLAPFGVVDLRARDALNITAGSVVSVSAGDLTVPFGRTIGGLEWVMPVGALNPVLSGAPERRIGLRAERIDVAPGASIDVSGRGTLLAREFVPGPGGSVDVLAPRNPGYGAPGANEQQFAILPQLPLEFAPHDAAEFEGAGLEFGDSIFLNAGPGHAAGIFPLLPASYALLPGALLVTPHAGAVDVVPGANAVDEIGQPIVSGYRLVAGTAIRDARWSAFRVEPGSIVRTRAEYLVSEADAFFAQRALERDLPQPALAADAGSLVVAAGASLRLAGSILAERSARGRAAQLEVLARNLLLTGSDRPGAGTGEVALDVRSLGGLGVTDIIFGARRERGAGQTTRLTVEAETVRVAGDVDLALESIILAARDALSIEAGARLTASGAVADAGEALTVDANAAVLGLFSRPEAGLQIAGGSVSGQAVLAAEAGSSLGAEGCLAAFAGGGIRLDADLDLRAADLEFRSAALALGAPVPGFTGTVLDPTALSQLAARAITLASTEAISASGSFTLQSRDLILEAPGLVGIGAGVRSLQAERISLSGVGSGVASATVGAGRFELSANELTLGPGRFSLLAGDTVAIAAGAGVFVEGSGTLASSAPLAIAAPLLHAAAGTAYTFEAGGASAQHGLVWTPGTVPAAAPAARSGLGARVELHADTLAFATRVVLPSGQLALLAQGDLQVGGASDIDLSGQIIRTLDHGFDTPGGSLTLSSSAGDVTIDSEARIDLSPAGAARGGSLALLAPNGVVNLGAPIIGRDASDQRGASVRLDVARLAPAALATFLEQVSQGGFTEAVRLRVRRDDIILGSGAELHARSVGLVADAGTITVAGTLDASGARAGRVELLAGGSVHITSGGHIRATASETNADGGELLISAIGADPARSTGITIDPGAVIELTGGVAREERQVSALGDLVRVASGPIVQVGEQTHVGGMLRTRVAAAAGASGLRATGELIGVGRAELEATAIVELPAGSVLNAAQLTTLRTQTATRMEGVVAPPGFTASAGLEIRSAGNLELASAIDLAGWRHGGEPGALTLRAAGDLLLRASISDGVRAESLAIGDEAATITRTLGTSIQTDRSWRYDLVAGADLASADPLAVGGDGDITLSPGAFVRTGTGAIRIAAGGDFVMGNAVSAVYTVGQRLPLSRELGLHNPYGTLGRLVSQFYAEYPINGGDISVDVGGRIQGATTATSTFRVGTRDLSATTEPFLSDWFVKAGAGVGYSGWGIALDIPTQVLTTSSGGVQLQNILNARSGFRQGIGALAGGDISVRAEQGISDLSAAVVTTGKPIGARANPTQSNNSPFLSRDILIGGGGDLRISSGGDINGGLLFADGGSAEVFARGSIAGGRQFRSGPVFALGAADLDVTAVGDLTVGSIIDPGMLTQVYSTAPGGRSSLFYLGAGAGQVQLTALAGDLRLANDINELSREATRYVARQQGTALVVEEQRYLLNLDFLRVLPGSVRAAALGGDLVVERSFNLFPHPSGQLELFADGDLATANTGDAVIINLLDSDPARFPSVLAPVAGFAADEVGILEVFNRNGLSHAATPMHVDDHIPVRISTRRGDIVANDRLQFALSKRVSLRAGRDLRDVDLYVQHARPGDISRIEAGRDIRFATRFDLATGLLASTPQEIMIGGGGQVLVTAGRDIDLGASNGIVTIGGIRNPALRGEGASLSLRAGFEPGADWLAFTRLLARQAPDRLLGTGVADWLVRRSGRLDLEAAGLAAELLSLDSTGLTQLAALAERPESQIELSARFFDVLRDSGVAGIRGEGFAAGADAISALFGDASRQGDILLYFSRLQTLSGGNIELLAPGGLINAGLAVSAIAPKPASELGIVVQASGVVDVFSEGDLQVNASRVFALGGGDITVWSANGDIDAGRGAKAALAVPPPRVTFDANGNLKVEFPAAVSGSGIRTATTAAGAEAGDVYLFAPRGVIDAGEAGIGGQDVFIFGEACLNCGNVDVGGLALGLPATVSVAVPAGVAAAAGSAAQAAQGAATESVAANDSGDSLAARGQTMPVLVTAELLGFGNLSVNEARALGPGDGSPRREEARRE
ncbi:MAG TPA: hypothetical protein DCY89_08315 [Gammaproteobacteria bacterium]|nr:hypothetical protein [Gammaproteobacteria bacterium]